ncbi:DUF2267 domain-containing protein [Lichenifustis flavocetrariae]|uniref:DUF2267 domain-containing protein n=1 Tax=Lichenifustis flavocetrariae TaxID=2949735 RepID=A0AA41YUP2_9HYPH|nr:DUF2267 domain-containing protein [Lichenifustis flavocetrariae]MCW6507526.1 DUF2267 domain-containing protein [Lichenifustis flavocetrariae]
MDELVERVSTSAGIEPEAAQKAIGLILNFLLKEGPEDQVNTVIDVIPGARAAMSGAAVEEDEGSVLNGLTGGHGGGLMGLAGQLSGLGLSMGEMQTIGREVLGYAREKAGEDTVGEIAGAIPGMHQLM